MHSTKDYIKGNTQSCADLVAYLDKENENLSFGERSFFFSHQDNFVNDMKVRQDIDSNVKGLKNKDAKFFMLTLNPSERELSHIAKQTTGRNINDISVMSTIELARYNEALQSFTRVAMDAYARNFGRGLTGNDLVYFAKIEQKRYFSRSDEEVKAGINNIGEPKPGFQTHVHIIVSRKDKLQKHSLSPLANSRGKGKQHKIKDREVKVGFDRVEFKHACELAFDKLFTYERGHEQKFDYYNSLNKGAMYLTTLASMEHVDPRMLMALLPKEMTQNQVVRAGKELDKLSQGEVKDILRAVTNKLADKAPVIKLVNRISKAIEHTVELGM